MQRDVIGMKKDGQCVYASVDEINQHILAVGGSGVGKTTFILQQIIQRVENHEEDAIVFNYHNTANIAMIHENNGVKYECYGEKIDVARDGILLPIFSKIAETDTDSTIKQRGVNLFTKVCGLTAAQRRELKGAVNVVFKENLYEKCGIKAIGDFLASQTDRTALGAAAKLDLITENNLIKNGSFWKPGNNLYDIDLNGLEYEAQIMVAEVVLNYIWNIAQDGRFVEKHLNILIDECQNFDFNEGTVMYMMLNEGRKHGINLILATQQLLSMKRNTTILQQCGTCAYFKPLDSERAKIAKMAGKDKEKIMLYYLSNLERGEFVHIGKGEVDRGKYRTPQVLKTWLDN